MGLVGTTSLAGETWHASSGSHSNILLELYTSEGCNSCPPAEEYLNGLKTHPKLWKSVFPLAFHVDYWNHLGWRDPYSQARHSVRQRAYAREMNKLFVYTPQLLINGKPWRRGFFKHSLPIIETRSGTLALTLADSRLEASFRPVNREAADYDLHVAILGMGLHSSIKAGENEGREAKHEFVVLASRQYQGGSHQQGNVRWQSDLPEIDSRQGAAQLALVAWVSKAGTLPPLQVTGGLLH